MGGQKGDGGRWVASIKSGPLSAKAKTPGRPSEADKKQKAQKEGGGMQNRQRGGYARIRLCCNWGGGLGHGTLVRKLAITSKTVR